MYSARHAGWLGPSGYIQTYPKIERRPSTWERLISWRRLLAFIVLAATTPWLAASAVNFYASSLVTYAPKGQVISENEMKPTPPPLQPVPAVQPVTPPTDEPDAGLKALLNSWAAGKKDHKWAVAVRGLDGDSRFASLNADQTFRSASLYKLLIMYPLLQKHSVSEFDKVKISAGSLGQCVNKMLRYSDNPCGEAVGSYVGWRKSDSALKTLGLVGTKLNDTKGPSTTAADVVTYLEQLYSGDKFSQEGRDYILSILQNQTWRKGIPTGCGGCVVANKTGDLGYVRHDAAIIKYSGGAYALAIFSDGASYSQIAQLTAQIQDYMSQN